MTVSSSDERSRAAVIFNGTIQCSSCTKAYPVRRGVAFLAALDKDWVTTLGEALARRRIFQRELDAVAFEGERAKRHEEQSTGVQVVMDTLFDSAVAYANVAPGSAVLDVGAGLCDTSSAWAARGCSVTAVETEAANLLHLRFEEIDSGDPEWVDIPTRRVYAQERRLRPQYFDRIVAPIHRLPFESGTFDVVFCRSVLHHLDDLSRCMKEMCRVLRPGGLLIACSEPARGIFDREDDQLIGGIDKEDGLNEQLPTWFQYRRALAPWVSDITVQPWLQDSSPSVQRFERFDLFRLRSRIWPGQAVSGLRLLKLLPFSSSINILARRTGVVAQPPAPTADHFADLTIDAVAKAALPESLQQSIDQFREITQELAACWRRLAAARGGYCALFVPGLAPERQLQIGWRRRCMDADAQPYRHTNRHSLVTLLAPAGSTRLEIQARQAFSPNTSDPQSVTVFCNGENIGTLTMQRDWSVFSLDLSDVQQGVADIELVAQTLIESDAEGSRAELGPAIRQIRILPGRD